MKTRLLKRLRRKAKKNVVIYKKFDLDWNFPYHIVCLDNKVRRILTSYCTLEETKIKLIETRRYYIIKDVQIMRTERENKQLRKL